MTVMARTFAGFYSKALSRPVVHKGELLSVQRLRGFAVLMVLIVHIEDIAQRLEGWAGYHSQYSILVGYSAPDMFFVISGFIMSYITFGTPFQPRRWLIARLVRIYPMYMFFTALVMVLWLLNPALTMGSGQHDWASVLQSMLMLPQAKLPLLFVGWTVEHEIVFYTTIFLTATLLGRQHIVKVLLILSALAVGKWALRETTAIELWDFHVASLYMIQFTMGALIFRYWEPLSRLGWRTPLALVVVLLVIGAAFAHSGEMNREQPLRVLAFGGAYSCLLLALLNYEKQQRAVGIAPTQRDWLVWVGDASYSVYLTHPFVLASYGKIFPHLSVPLWGQWLLVVLVGATILAVGIVTHILLEKPVIELGKLLTKPRNAAAKTGLPT